MQNVTMKLHPEKPFSSKLDDDYIPRAEPSPTPSKKSRFTKIKRPRFFINKKRKLEQKQDAEEIVISKPIPSSVRVHHNVSIYKARSLPNFTLNNLTDSPVYASDTDLKSSLEPDSQKKALISELKLVLAKIGRHESETSSYDGIIEKPPRWEESIWSWKSVHPEKWSNKQVCDWLNFSGFHRASNALCSKDIDGRKLKGITTRDLSNYGLDDIGTSKAIIENFHAYYNNEEAIKIDQENKNIMVKPIRRLSSIFSQNKKVKPAKINNSEVDSSFCITTVRRTESNASMKLMSNPNDISTRNNQLFFPERHLDNVTPNRLGRPKEIDMLPQRSNSYTSDQMGAVEVILSNRVEKDILPVLITEGMTAEDLLLTHLRNCSNQVIANCQLFECTLESVVKQIGRHEQLLPIVNSWKGTPHQFEILKVTASSTTSFYKVAHDCVRHQESAIGTIFNNHTIFMNAHSEKRNRQKFARLAQEKLADVEKSIDWLKQEVHKIEALNDVDDRTNLQARVFKSLLTVYVNEKIFLEKLKGELSQENFSDDHLSLYSIARNPKLIFTCVVKDAEIINCSWNETCKVSSTNRESMLQIDDTILEINGVSTLSWSSQRLLQFVRQASLEEAFKLVLLRNTNEVDTLSIDKLKESRKQEVYAKEKLQEATAQKEEMNDRLERLEYSQTYFSNENGKLRLDLEQKRVENSELQHLLSKLGEAHQETSQFLATTIEEKTNLENELNNLKFYLENVTEARAKAEESLKVLEAEMELVIFKRSTNADKTLEDMDDITKKCLQSVDKETLIAALKLNVEAATEMKLQYDDLMQMVELYSPEILRSLNEDQPTKDLSVYL